AKPAVETTAMVVSPVFTVAVVVVLETPFIEQSVSWKTCDCTALAQFGSPGANRLNVTVPDGTSGGGGVCGVFTKPTSFAVSVRLAGTGPPGPGTVVSTGNETCAAPVPPPGTPPVLPAEAPAGTAACRPLGAALASFVG